MNKKVLFTVAPTLLLMGSLVGCKGGNSPTPSATVEAIKAEVPGTAFYVGSNIERTEVNVWAKYSDKSDYTLVGTSEDVKFSPSLPYKFVPSDSTKGKKFTVTYKEKSCEFSVTPTLLSADIDWVSESNVKLSDGKDYNLYEVAQKSKNITFGLYSQYKDKVKDIKEVFAVDEIPEEEREQPGFIKAYVDESKNNEEEVAIDNLYILSDAIIYFNENDAVDPDGTAFFEDCSKTESITIDNVFFDVDNYFGMFLGCTNLKDINGLDSLNFSTKDVTSMNQMFNNCSSLVTLNLSKFNTQNVKDFSAMFENCQKLETIYTTDKFNVDKEANCVDMFLDCKSLVGGNGTSYNNQYKDGDYARIDDPKSSKPGYFTDSTLETSKFLMAYKPISDKFQNDNSVYDPNDIKIKINDEEPIEANKIEFIGKDPANPRKCSIDDNILIAGGDYEAKEFSEKLLSYKDYTFKFVSGDNIVGIEAYDNSEKKQLGWKFNSNGYLVENFDGTSTMSYIYSCDPGVVTEIDLDWDDTAKLFKSSNLKGAKAGSRFRGTINKSTGHGVNRIYFGDGNTIEKNVGTKDSTKKISVTSVNDGSNEYQFSLNEGSGEFELTQLYDLTFYVKFTVYEDISDNLFVLANSVFNNLYLINTK